MFTKNYSFFPTFSSRSFKKVVLVIRPLLQNVYYILVTKSSPSKQFVTLNCRFHEGNGNVQDATRKVPRVAKIPSLVKKVLQHIYCIRRMTKNKLIQIGKFKFVLKLLQVESEKKQHCIQIFQKRIEKYAQMMLLG